MDETHKILIVYLTFLACYPLRVLLPWRGIDISRRLDASAGLGPIATFRKIQVMILFAVCDLRALPIYGLVMSITLLSVGARGKRSTTPCSDNLPDEINPDIGGIGVLLGLFSPSFVMLILLVQGHRKKGQSGVKELCIAQFANLINLTFNLAKSMTTLTYREVLIVCCCIDGVSAAISMAFSDKDVLAARTLAFLCSIGKAVALVVQGVAFRRLINDQRKSMCTPRARNPLLETIPELLWAYLFIRLLLLAAPTPAARHCSKVLNVLERAHRGLRTQTNGSQQKNIALSLDAKKWRSLPCTLSGSYLVYFSVLAIHMVSVPAISLNRSFEQSWKNLWSQWGQSAAFIVAVATIGHVCWPSICGAVARLRRFLRAPQILSESSTFADLEAPNVLSINQPDNITKNSRELNDILVDPGFLKRELSDWEILSEEERSNKLRKEIIQCAEQNDRAGLNHYLTSSDEYGEPPPDCQDMAGNSILHMAAKMNDLEIFRKFYSTGKELERNFSSETPLDVVVKFDSTQVLQWILGSILSRDPVSGVERRICVKLASRCLRSGIEIQGRALKVLLTSWPDVLPRWQTLRLHDTGRCPLAFAVKNNKIRALKELLDYHDDLPNYNMMHWTRLFEDVKTAPIVEQLLQKALPIPIINADIIMTALHFDHLQILLDHGISRDDIFYQAIYISRFKVVWRLLEEHRSTTTCSTKISDRALDYAATFLEEMKLRTQIVREGGQDWSEFHLQIGRNSISSMKDLIDFASRKNEGKAARMISSKTKKGESAFRLAMRSSIFDCYEEGCIEYLKLFLENGACVDDTSFDGTTILHDVTSRNLSKDILAPILRKIEKNALSRVINARDVYGNTAIHLLWRLWIHSGPPNLNATFNLVILLKNGASIDLSHKRSVGRGEEIFSSEVGLYCKHAQKCLSNGYTSPLDDEHVVKTLLYWRHSCSKQSLEVIEPNEKKWPKLYKSFSSVGFDSDSTEKHPPPLQSFNLMDWDLIDLEPSLKNNDTDSEPDIITESD